MIQPTFYEFFAGGGMARAGLGSAWRCLFANDFDVKKADAYRLNWGEGEMRSCDVRTIKSEDLAGEPDLVWASFPCQDLSLAGGGAGLKGERSGTFWPFWELIKQLRSEGRHPKLLVLENVCGTLTSHGGKDFSAICRALAKENYKFGAVVVDAALFLPQSRPRLFIIATRDGVEIPPHLVAQNPVEPFHTRALISAFRLLPAKLQNGWIWWHIADVPKRNFHLANVIEENPVDVSWHSAQETSALVDKMSPLHLEKVAAAKRLRRKMVGAAYRRTRYDANGEKVQRTEARFDDLAGCLRTPAGGSSRQFIFVVENGRIRSRLISARETARLMGLPDDYKLPSNYNEAYHLTGDGVAVPVVRHLAGNILEPVLQGVRRAEEIAA